MEKRFPLRIAMDHREYEVQAIVKKGNEATQAMGYVFDEAGKKHRIESPSTRIRLAQHLAQEQS